MAQCLPVWIISVWESLSVFMLVTRSSIHLYFYPGCAGCRYWKWNTSYLVRPGWCSESLCSGSYKHGCPCTHTGGRQWHGTYCRSYWGISRGNYTSWERYSISLSRLCQVFSTLGIIEFLVLCKQISFFKFCGEYRSGLLRGTSADVVGVSSPVVSRNQGINFILCDIWQGCKGASWGLRWLGLCSVGV